MIIEEENGRIRGLFLGYPARDMKQLSLNMSKSIKDIYRLVGFTDFLKMMSRFGLNTHFPRTEKDGFFISNLAVFEEHRGKGVAEEIQ